jgi:hypothetical protein
MHSLLARLSSILHLAALSLVCIVLFGFAISFLYPPFQHWLNSSGNLRLLVVSVLYVGLPLAALSATFGLIARCPNCAQPYLKVMWLSPPTNFRTEGRSGVSLVRASLNVALGREHACRNCKYVWR